MGWSAFAPQSRTLTITVTTAASTPQQCPPSQGYPTGNCYRVSNASAQGCFLTHAATAANSIPDLGVAGTTTRGQWIQGNSTEVFQYGPGSWFSAIGTAATTLYITCGDGL